VFLCDCRRGEGAKGEGGPMGHSSEPAGDHHGGGLITRCVLVHS
jgi:hypothetical protein